MLTSRTNKKPLLQTILGIVSIALSIFGLSTSSIALAQTNTTTPTTIVIPETTKTTTATRLGINLGTQDYWDSGILKRNLAFNNPGFEGESWQSILHCKTVTANTCTDDNVWAYWPANFFAKATASFIVGPATGTVATVTSSTAPVPGVTATTVQLSGLSVAPSVGDYVVVRMEVPGNAQAGWWTQGTGATYSTETTDLSPNTPGKQALVVNASAAGAQAVLANYNDGIAGKSFLQMNGSYTVSFRAKSTGGSTDLHINLKRAVVAPATDNFFDRDVTLTNQWQDYSFTYQLSEPTVQIGTVGLTFTLTGGSMYIDDAALTEGASADNPTAYRDSVVSTLKALHPGTIRYQDSNNWGSSIDNLLATDFARERAGYSTGNSEQDVIAMGLHDFLVLCQTVGADPWFTIPTGMTTQEMSNLMDYFGGSASTVYGAKRVALGQTAPWTTVFGQIHLEFGNEVWNTANAGALMTDPASYGKRGGVIFTTAKASASYNAKSFDFILDGFGAIPAWTATALQNSTNYNTTSVASYSFTNFADASSIENIYGPMFAQPELMNDTSAGIINQNATSAASGGPTPANLAVYETNINTTNPTTTQAQVNAVVPSLGAGLSVAANMLLAQRDLGVTIQNLYALTGYQYAVYGNASVATVPIWGATIDMGGATNLQRPMFLSVQLANSAILPSLLSTSQSGLNPTWNQALSTNDSVALAGAHYIQSMAYTDGTTLNVILFNLSRTSALPVNFAGLNAPIGTATVSTLTASSIEANNENGQGVAITTTSESLVGGSTMTLPPYSMTVVSVPAPTIQILVSSVTAACANSSLSASGTTTCSSTVVGQGKYSSAVTWSTTAGTISSTGVYTAPATLPSTGKAVITATSTQDTTKSGSFTITLASNAVTGITASCPATSVNQGAVINCTATVSGTGGFSNAYKWSASTGSISSTGSFTAPDTGTSVTLTATSTQDSTKSASVTLSLNTVLIMSTPTASVGSTTATLNWTTNLSAYGGIAYGATTSLGLTSPSSTYDGPTHSVTISGLLPSTTYYLSAFSFVGSQTVGQTMTITTTNGAASVSGVTVNCSALSLVLGASTGCSATVQGSGSYSSAVTWSTSLGSISSTGVLTAPLSLTASSITVTARSVQDATKSGSVTLTLNPPNAVTAVSVSCQATTITDSSKTTCSPTVTTTGTASTAVTWSASAGSITSTGVLTAPSTGSSVTVTATSVANPAKSASTVITLLPLPTITGVTVACQATSLSTGGNTLCTSTVAGTGSYASAVTWSASAGSITSAGSFTAPTTGTSVTVKATSTQDPTKSGSATIQLNAVLGLSGLTSSAITSTSATITWTTNLAAYGGVAYGTTPSLGLTSPSSAYEGTAHSVTLTGLTPSTTYYLAVFSYLANQSTASQVITVTTAAATPTVTGVSVSCQPTTLVGGKSEVCTSTVSGTGSYSSAVTWSASAGSITSTGVLTAPTTGTSVTVKATSVQDPTKYATATVTVTQPATVSAVTVSCPITMLPIGQSITCGATVTGTGSPSTAVTWSASSGSITEVGAFTAPTSGTSTTLTATSTQDPTKSASIKLAILEPQAIVNPNFLVTSTTIVVSWNLTELAYSKVSYGNGGGTNSISMPQTATAATTASFTLTGLKPGTTYNTTIYSTNKWGTVSQTKSVTTSLK